MDKVVMFAGIILLASCSSEKPAYLNTRLSFEDRAMDLVSRMTLQEKVDQMMYHAPAIERLGIPEYNWWNECLHGVGMGWSGYRVSAGYWYGGHVG